MKSYLKLLIWVTIFSIAMGYLESAVVVYLRAIMYPDGFHFPLVPINHQLAITEVFREAATLVMLLGIGFLAGKTFAGRFAWFIYSFAIWDIFYYVFLKLLIGWPETFMTWDILFLIPVTWVGPVISPVIASFTMIALALIIIHFDTVSPVKIKSTDWLFLIAGSAAVIISFTWDYSSFILNHYSISELWGINGKKAFYDLSLQYIPRKFNWLIFWIGEGIIIAGIVSLFTRLRRLSTDKKVY